MDRLLALARARGGVVTSGLAARVGVDEHGLVAARRSGLLVRVRRDAYVVGALWAAAGPEERLALRARAVLLSRRDPVAASHEAALALHGLPLMSPVGSTVDVVADVTRTRRGGSLHLHPRGPEPDVVVDGVRVVPLPVAVAQVALRSGLRPGIVALDAALARGSCDLDALRAALAHRATTAAALRRGEELVALGDPRAESPGESLTRLLLHDLGYPARSQVVVHDEEGRFVARVDLLVHGRVVVEFDGAVKYEGADGRAALVAEKRREDRLRALGYTVVRVTWADLHDPARFARLVRRALMAAGV